MSFQVGTFKDGLHLAAVCDDCGEAVKADRNKNMDCILPDGWIKKERVQTGSVFFIQTYQSHLSCPGCQREQALPVDEPDGSMTDYLF